jgi:hypothetical protein
VAAMGQANRSGPHSSVCILVSSRNADYVGRRHHIGDMPMLLPHLPDTWPLLMSLNCLRLKLLQVFASDFTMHARRADAD